MNGTKHNEQAAQADQPGTAAGQIRVADEAGIAAAADVILAGGLVAVPTETVYGLAARADDDAAVAGIYRAKGRPDFNPLIVHVPDLSAAERLAHLGERGRLLAAHFWPGPLTMVLARRQDAGLANAVSAGLPTIALRCPDHQVMQALLVACGLPLAAPSANRSGGVSPTSPAHVAASLGDRVGMVLDGGETRRGIESTIVAIRTDGGWALLRPGPIGKASISAILGPSDEVKSSSIEAPGQLASHYSPGKPIRLDALETRPGEFLIGFGPVAGDISLSETGDLDEAAARLYACMHFAGASQCPCIAVAPIPQIGVGAAINDRLARAAA
jgi:L-threonylcarbamoyladenylate synthase